MIGENTEKAIDAAVNAEKKHCIEVHGEFKNHHEAYGVIKEEMEEVQDAAELFNGRAMNNLHELWQKVKDDDMTDADECIQKIYDTAEELTKECVQVMAVCRKWLRLVEKECEKNE